MTYRPTTLALVELVDWPGYFAGSDGHIYSTHSKGPGARPGGRAPFALKEGIEKKKGYANVGLSRKGARKTVRVAPLVCAAFHGPRPEGMTCSHLNGNGLDNRPENLLWESLLCNVRRRSEHGTGSANEQNPSAKLNWSAVREIRKRYAAGQGTQCQLASEFGVTHTAISFVVNGRTWCEPSSGAGA